MLALLQDPLGLMPPAASTFAPDVDLFNTFTTVVCLFFFFLITGILGFSVFKWRRRTPTQPAASAVTHNTPLEVVWTVIPLIIVMVIFAWGWKGSLDMGVAPADALTYEAVGQQWSWTIKHPDGMEATNEMYVPLGVPVRVNLYSKDVLHSFFIPAFRTKRDVLPGRYQLVWFQATKTGTYDLFCAEYCGKDHSYMLGKVHVLDYPRDYFLGKLQIGGAPPWHQRPEDPVEWGKLLWKQKCSACHTIDGVRLVGPTWKGLWGSTEELADGSKVKVDEAYVTESIRSPNVKITKGNPPYPPLMTAFDLKDDAIKAIIEFMKTLK